ncbi:MAG: ATP-binding cassette domain-containing protein [Bacteroidota bacterium]
MPGAIPDNGIIAELKGVIPEPLAGKISAASGIWNTNIQFRKGRKYRVSAASGKGKSTFTGILYGLRTDFSGSASLLGQDVKATGPGQWAEARQKEVSIIFQDLRLFLNRTARENLAVKASLSGKDAESYMKHAEELANLLGVLPLFDRTCGTLSYGERQRIAIIRALVQPFSLLLMDEPFSHLDDANIAIATKLVTDECIARNAGYIVTSLGHDYFPGADESLYF